MYRSSSWRYVILCLALSSPAGILCLAFSSPAGAQVIWNMPNVVIPPAKIDRSEVKSRPDAWPRLDRGSAICKTEEDLLRLAASRRGDPVAAPNCQIIRTATAVQIMRRNGPGRTQVSITDQAGAAGWTDAWLPEKPPPIGNKGVTIR
jgi:hypothetical protein